MPDFFEATVSYESFKRQRIDMNYKWGNKSTVQYMFPKNGGDHIKLGKENDALSFNATSLKLKISNGDFTTSF